jgi:sugar lactone lactonase YvrE
MKRYFPMICLVTVFSLSLSVIWPTQAMAAPAPTFASLGQIDTLAAGCINPLAMDQDDNGYLYVADLQTRNVCRFDPLGALTHKFRPVAPYINATGLAISPDGSKLYVAKDNDVVIFNPTTGAVLGTLTGDPLASPNEFEKAGPMDFDVDGNLIVTDTFNMTVKVYDADGLFKTRFGGPGTLAGEFQQIGGLEVSPSGQILVTDSSGLAPKLHVFTWDSVNYQVVGPPVAYDNENTTVFGPGIFHNMGGIAFDTLGRIYIVGYLNSEIRVLDSDFTFLLKVTDVQGLGSLKDLSFDATNSRLLLTAPSAIGLFGIDGGTNPVAGNTAPDVPVIDSPKDGNDVSVLTPTLKFFNTTDPESDPITYHVHVEDKDMVTVFETDLAYGIGQFTSTTIPGGTLVENEIYSWTVEATDGEDASLPSAPAFFAVNTVEELPSVPAGLMPANGTVMAGPDALSWSASTDPDPNDTVITYQVEIADDAGFVSVVLSEAVAGTSVTLESLVDYLSLVDGNGYFWRITALDPDLDASAPSVANQFIYDTTVLNVTSNMPGSDVYLGGNHGFVGRKVGSAPLELRDLAVGPVTVVVERPGFEAYVETVTLAAAGNVSVAANLAPAMVPAGLKVRNDGINGRSGLSVSGSAVPFIVDFDSDGMLDMLVGDASGQVQLFAAMDVVGDRLYFAPGTSVALPVLPGASPFVADWDNDGRKDLLVGVADGTVKLFLNTGTESAPAFGAGQDLMAGGGILNVGAEAAPAVVDLNDDDLKDLVVANDSGQVFFCLNQSSDAAPQLSSPIELFQAAGAASVFPSDWDADGQVDLLVTVAGETSVYTNDAGMFTTQPVVSVLSNDSAAVFPMDIITGTGKEMITGGQNGRLTYIENLSDTYVAEFRPALEEKVTELAGFVSDEDPAKLTDVNAILADIQADNLPAAQAATATLSGQLLPGGDAQQSANELEALLN